MKSAKNKTAVVVNNRNLNDIHFGQTVDILSEERYVVSDLLSIATIIYTIKPHGSNKSYLVASSNIQLSENAYNYDTNPMVINPYKE